LVVHDAFFERFALSSEIPASQSPHGLFGGDPKRRHGRIEGGPLSLNVVYSGFRRAFFPDLIDPIIHFCDEDMQIFDVGQNSFFPASGKGLYFTGDIVKDCLPAGELHFHGFAAIFGFHDDFLPCYSCLVKPVKFRRWS